MDADQSGGDDTSSAAFSSWPAVEFLFDDEPGGEEEKVSNSLHHLPASFHPHRPPPCQDFAGDVLCCSPCLQSRGAPPDAKCRGVRDHTHGSPAASLVERRPLPLRTVVAGVHASESTGSATPPSVTSYTSAASVHAPQDETG